MFARLRQLVVGFFVYNLVNVVVSFHVFIDVCVSLRTAHKASKGAPSALGGYERSAAAFLFFEFLLSMLACIFAVKAVEEARCGASSRGAAPIADAPPPRSSRTRSATSTPGSPSRWACLCECCMGELPWRALQS